MKGFSNDGPLQILKDDLFALLLLDPQTALLSDLTKTKKELLLFQFRV